MVLLVSLVNLVRAVSVRIGITLFPEGKDSIVEIEIILLVCKSNIKSVSRVRQHFRDIHASQVLSWVSRCIDWVVIHQDSLLVGQESGAQRARRGLV